MNLIDNLFITPHAIEQFQKRIARLSDEQAREVIRAGVSQAANVRKFGVRRLVAALDWRGLVSAVESGNKLPHSTDRKLFPDGEVE
jgi:hypothetical protein